MSALAGTVIKNVLKFSLMGFAIYFLYNEARVYLKNIDTVKANLVKLEIAAILHDQEKKDYKRQLDMLNNSIVNKNKLILEQQKVMSNAAAYKHKTDAVLAKHDLSRLAVKKTQLIENIINAATADTLRVFRERSTKLASGGSSP